MGIQGQKGGKRIESKMKELKKIMKAYTDCLWSFFVSLAGGVLLAWWEYEYHPANSQLWMVPFGLILFFTPLIIWFAIFVSDICCASSTEDVSRPDGSIHDPEKVMIKPVVSTSTSY